MNTSQQRLEGFFGSGRRRIWWAREGGLISGVSQTEPPPANVVIPIVTLALLGIGAAILVKKAR